MIEKRQRSASLEQDARKPRLVTEVDVPTDTKTRRCMEDVTAERVIRGDNASADVHPDPVCMASFVDDSTGPPALPCSRNGTLVNNGADTVSTAMNTIFFLPLPSWTLGEEDKERTSRTNNINLPFPTGGRLYKRNQGKTLVFDPGDYLYRSYMQLPVTGKVTRIA